MSTAPRGTLLAILAVCVACVVLPAAHGSHDARLTLRARQAIFSDPDLAPYNLGVSVREGAAILIGTVPSAELARRAIERVRQVAGLREVQSELSVVPPSDPILPRPSSVPAGPARPPAALTSVQPPPRPPSGEEIMLAVERLRRLDARYRGLRVQMTGRVVFLRGTVARGEDAMDLAQAIAKVPGVERVVLQQIQTGSPR